MKKFTKKYPDPKRILLTAGMALTMIAFCGCGNSSDAGTTGSSSSSSTQRHHQKLRRTIQAQAMTKELSAELPTL